MTPFKFRRKKETTSPKSQYTSSPVSQNTISNAPSPNTLHSSSNAPRDQRDVSSSSNYSVTPQQNQYTQFIQQQQPQQQFSQYPQHPQQTQQPQQPHQQQNQYYSAGNHYQASEYDRRNQNRSVVTPQRGHHKYPSQSSQQSPTPQPLTQQILTPWSTSKLIISPFPRYRHVASTTANEKGEIFIMGGLHSTSVYGDTWIIKEDTQRKSFQTLQVDISENSPAPRVGHASTLCGNAYVIFGGDTVTNDAGEIDNDLYLFNMNSHGWTIPRPIGQKPSGRYGHTIGVVAITNLDSKLYLYGGQLDDFIYNDLVMFNLSSFRRPDSQWEWITPQDSVKPPGLTNHSMDIYDNKLWIFGGNTGAGLSNQVWVFDPSTNKWENIKTTGEIPKQVEEHASLIYKDLLIIHGGKNSDGEALNDVYFLNLTTKTWFKLPSHLAQEPQGKYGHSLSLLSNDQLIILGGHLPDFARVGDDLEPSLEDNGVGTIISSLDLTHLSDLIPGLYSYSTPQTGAQGRFQRQVSNSNIFTPPPDHLNQHTPHRNAENISPEKYINYSSQSATPISSSAPNFNNQTRTPPPSSKPPSATHTREYPQSSHISFAGTEESLPLDVPEPLDTKKGLLSPPPTYRDDDTSFDYSGAYDEDLETPPATTKELTKDVNPSQRSSNKFPASGSDFFDNYVNNSSTASLEDKNLAPKVETAENGISQKNDVKKTPDTPRTEKTEKAPIVNRDILTQDAADKASSSELKDSAQSSNAILGIGATTALAVGTGLKNIFVGEKSTDEKQNEAHTIPGGFTLATQKAIDVSNERKDNDEQSQFKSIIESLSAELEQLKVSTNEKIKSTSLKINQLEEENNTLKDQLNVDSDDGYKSKYVKLNADHQILSIEHQTLKSNLEHINPIFTKNLIDLSKLNEIIKNQEADIKAKVIKSQEQEDWKLKYDQLKLEYDSLLDKSHENEPNRSLDYEPTEVSKLSQSIDLFLANYISKDDETGEVRAKGLHSNDSSVIESLRSQIHELLQENELIQNQNKKLSSNIEELSSQGSELETLRNKIAELSKLEENYKESLYSVKNTSRALQISQSELAKQKEVSNKLQAEIDDLKIFKSRKVSSRLGTPLLNDTTDNSSDVEGDDDIENEHFNLKLRDLQAELFITKQERDELKDNVLVLKKKLLVNNTPTSSL